MQRRATYSQIKDGNLPTLETGLRGLKTVFQIVMYCGSGRVQKHLKYYRFHHLPRFKAPGQTADTSGRNPPYIVAVVLLSNIYDNTS